MIFGGQERNPIPPLASSTSMYPFNLFVVSSRSPSQISKQNTKRNGLILYKLGKYFDRIRRKNFSLQMSWSSSTMTISEKTGEVMVNTRSLKWTREVGCLSPATVTSRDRRDLLLCRSNVSMNYSATKSRTLDNEKSLTGYARGRNAECLESMWASIQKELRSPAPHILEVHVAESQASN